MAGRAPERCALAVFNLMDGAQILMSAADQIPNLVRDVQRGNLPPELLDDPIFTRGLTEGGNKFSVGLVGLGSDCGLQRTPAMKVAMDAVAEATEFRLAKKSEHIEDLDLGPKLRRAAFDLEQLLLEAARQAKASR